MSAAPKPVWGAEEVKRAILPHLESIVSGWGVKLTGKRTQAGWLQCHAIDREDDNPSAGINVKTGAYNDFGGDGKAISVFDLAIKLGIYPDFNAAVNGLGERYGATPKVPLSKNMGHVDFDSAVKATGRTPSVKGIYESHWVYHNLDGSEAFRIVRYKTSSAKGKTYRPFHQVDGQWLTMDPPGLLPLYGLADLPRTGPVLIFEGEKVTGLARGLGLGATTSAHGAKSAHKSDWSPLAGREVVIVPDAGKEGDVYAAKIGKQLEKLSPRPSVRVLRLPGLEDSEDLEQWLERAPDNWDEERCGAEILKLANKAIDPGPEPETIPFTNRFDLGILGSIAFSNTLYPREWLVKRVLVKGKPCVIGGPKKSLKTSFVIDLVVSLGGAVRFLDQFDVARPVKTLVISGESGEATIQETMRRVCRSKGIEPADLEGFVFWGFKLPQLGDSEEMAAVGEFIRTNGIGCVVIDPLYLCLINGGRRIDPANLFDVGPLLKQVCDVCIEAGATPLLVHHFRKNRESPYESPEMEDLAFAGIQEFARQWILLGRRERYEPGSGEHKLWLSVGGSDGHSGEWAVDVAEGVIDEDFRDRDWRLTVSSATEAVGRSKEDATRAKVDRLAETAKLKDQVKERNAHNDAETALDALSKSPNRMKTKNGLRESLSWSGSRITQAVEILIGQGRIRSVDRIEFVGGDGKNRFAPGYEFVTNDLPDSTPDNPGQPRIQPRTTRGCPGFSSTPDNPG